jgi:hypothetical protein
MAASQSLHTDWKWAMDLGGRRIRMLGIRSCVMYGRPNIGDGLIGEMQIIVSFLGSRGDSSGVIRLKCIYNF